MRGHYQQGAVSGNGFAIYDSLRQVVEEYQANGTSGPFAVPAAAAPSPIRTRSNWWCATRTSRIWSSKWCRCSAMSTTASSP
ncbi:hypothetical protein LP420_32655 [Massilia sp. B-10]|nr:hypothetical protein LP420_32655 [Massilia sp. B-10]